jgi:hypothetical protein
VDFGLEDRSYFEYVISNESKSDYYREFGEYKKLLNNQTKNWCLKSVKICNSIELKQLNSIKNKTYKTLNEFYSAIKFILSIEDLERLKLQILENCEFEYINNYDLEQEAINIEILLKKEINIFNCPASKYEKYKEMAQKTAKWQK